MTDRQIENRIRKLQELEAQAAEIEKQAEAIRAELKSDLEEKQTEEITTAHGWIIRWKSFITNRFDSKAFKKDHADLYSEYTTASESRRFTVTA